MVAVAKKDNPLYILSKFVKKPGVKPRKKFLKVKQESSLIKHPEVEIIKKLEEAPAQVSLLNLVLASEEHMKMLLKVLGETYLPKTVLIYRFEQRVGHILASNTIAFTDDDILEEGTGNKKPLHIAAISSRYLLGGVMTDGGFALNVCPYDTQ